MKRQTDSFEQPQELSAGLLGDVAGVEIAYRSHFVAMSSDWQPGMDVQVMIPRRH